MLACSGVMCGEELFVVPNWSEGIDLMKKHTELHVRIPSRPGQGVREPRRFVTSIRGGGFEDMEQSGGHRQFVFPFPISVGKQAASQQFVIPDSGEGMSSMIDHPHTYSRDVPVSAVFQLSSAVGEFVILGRSEGMSRTVQSRRGRQFAAAEAKMVPRFPRDDLSVVVENFIAPIGGEGVRSKVGDRAIVGSASNVPSSSNRSSDSNVRN